MLIVLDTRYETLFFQLLLWLVFVRNKLMNETIEINKGNTNSNWY